MEISALCGAIPVCASLMAALGTATGSVQPQCASDQLAISLGPYGAGAGHIGVLIRFQNEGRPCRLRGYPGIDGLSADGRVVVRAKRLLHGYLGGARQIATITLGRGQSAQRFSRGPTSPFTASLVIHIAIFASHRRMRRAASGSTLATRSAPRDSSRRFRQDRDAQIGRQLWAKTARGGEAPAASERAPALPRAEAPRRRERHPASARKAGAPA